MKHTPLYLSYHEHQAKLVEFAGYEMPAQYRLGVKAEHLWCRQHAGFFDISHMGQAWLIAESGKQEDAAKAMEELVGADLLALEPGKQQYTQLLNEQGGILDDLIITKPAGFQDRLYTVVNAACKEQDFAYISQKLRGKLRLESLETSDERALMALQGPQAISVAQRYFPGVQELAFMSWATFPWEGEGSELYISRSGYTGEDGIEISVPAEQALSLARCLLAEDEVEPIGLGARDSLRLEAGLCLYGADLDPQTTPVEASLLWSIGKRRREEGAFAGAAIIQEQIANGIQRKRIGLDIQSKTPCRSGTAVFSGVEKVGEITSGGFAPCLDKPIAMAYVSKAHSKIGTELELEVRGKRIPAQVCKMPFITQKYAK